MSPQYVTRISGNQLQAIPPFVVVNKFTFNISLTFASPPDHESRSPKAVLDRLDWGCGASRTNGPMLVVSLHHFKYLQLMLVGPRFIGGAGVVFVVVVWAHVSR